MLLVVLLIIAGNICSFARSSNPTETEFFRNVKNNVEKIGANITQILTNDLKPGENFIFSPLNIYGALALIHLGATGTTKTELCNLLGLPAEDEKLAESHQNFGKLLYGNIQNATSLTSKVKIANGIFIQRGIKVNPEYARNVQNYYKSKTRRLNFAQGGFNATNFVNKWVSKKTNHRIRRLFDEPISTDTEILLASALYFAGKWAKCFDTENTETKTFNAGVSQIQVATMGINQSVPYVDNKELKFEAISIPYLYAEFSMLIVLPYRDQSIRTLVNAFKPGQLSEVIASSKQTYVNYELPRMKFRWSNDIKRHLAKLGIKQMFDRAELGKMIDSINLSVSQVTHAAEIEVNEKGTVASAVTAVPVSFRMGGPFYTDPPIPFHVNRPFLFSIYHGDTGVILFTGAVQNPTAENV